MKPIFDIFSKKRIIKEDKFLPVIIVDYREKNSLVISKLIEAGMKVQFQELKVADYLINGTAIERKTVSDFISSMLNRRLIKQLEEIQQYENRLLIIEGIEEQELYSEKQGARFHSEAIEEIASQCKEGKNLRENRRLSLHPNSIRGFLLSILLRYKVPIIFTKDSEDTAKFLELIARKKQRENSFNVKKRTLNKKERLQYIIESFPGIGPKTARKLLEKFKKIKNIANASEEEIKEVIGKKAEIFKLLEEEY